MIRAFFVISVLFFGVVSEVQAQTYCPMCGINRCYLRIGNGFAECELVEGASSCSGNCYFRPGPGSCEDPWDPDCGAPPGCDPILNPGLCPVDLRKSLGPKDASPAVFEGRSKLQLCRYDQGIVKAVHRGTANVGNLFVSDLINKDKSWVDEEIIHVVAMVRLERVLSKTKHSSGMTVFALPRSRNDLEKIADGREFPVQAKENDGRFVGFTRWRVAESTLAAMSVDAAWYVMDRKSRKIVESRLLKVSLRRTEDGQAVVQRVTNLGPGPALPDSALPIEDD